MCIRDRYSDEELKKIHADMDYELGIIKTMGFIAVSYTHLDVYKRQAGDVTSLLSTMQESHGTSRRQR